MKPIFYFLNWLFAEFLFNCSELIGAKVTKQVKVMYPEGVDMSGSSRGTTHSKNHYGRYIKSKSVPRQPRTSFQTAVRGSFTDLSQLWRSLTPAERLAWNASAINFPQKNVFGQGFTWTGQNFYMSVNRNLDAIGAARITSPPLPTAVEAVLLTSVVANTTGGLLTLNFAPAINVATSVLLSATPGVSAGKSNIASRLRQIRVLTDANATG